MWIDGVQQHLWYLMSCLLMSAEAQGSDGKRKTMFLQHEMSNIQQELHQVGIQKHAEIIQAHQKGLYQNDALQGPAEGTYIFQVVLVRATLNEKFGIRFVSQADGSMKVMSIGAGLCNGHNEQMRYYPKHSHHFKRQVIPNDYIIGVNGNSSTDKMKEHLLNGLVVHILVRRTPLALTN